jgi:hypothetical protein
MLPSPSLGPPLLSASPSPPPFCGMPALLLGDDSAPPGLEVPLAGWDGSSEAGFGVEGFGAWLELPPLEPGCMFSSELACGGEDAGCSDEEPFEEDRTGTLAAGAFAAVVLVGWVLVCAACFLEARAAGVVVVGVVAPAAAAAGVVAGAAVLLDLLEPPHPAAIADTVSRVVPSASARSPRPRVAARRAPLDG